MPSLQVTQQEKALIYARKNIVQLFTDLIAWQDGGAIPAAGGVLVNAAPPTANSAVIAAPVQSASSTATTGGTLAAATYWYVVTALTAAGETTKSNEISQVTTGSTSTVTINWAAVTGATGYKIYRGTATGVENVFYTVGAVVTFTDTGAANTAGTPPVTNTAGLPVTTQAALVAATTGGALPANTYYYVITALNAAGESLKSNEQSVTTTASTSQVTVSWSAVTGATGYNIYRGLAAGGEGQYYTVGAVTSYVDVGTSVVANVYAMFVDVVNGSTFEQQKQTERVISRVLEEVLLSRTSSATLNQLVQAYATYALGGVLANSAPGFPVDPAATGTVLAPFANLHAAQVQLRAAWRASGLSKGLRAYTR